MERYNQPSDLLPDLLKPGFFIAKNPQFLGEEFRLLLEAIESKSDPNTLPNELEILLNLTEVQLGLLTAVKMRNLEQPTENSEKISPDKTTIKFNLEEILRHISEVILPKVNESIQIQLKNKDIENVPIVYLLTTISQLYQYYFEGNFLNLENILKQPGPFLSFDREQDRLRESVYQQLLEIKRYFINYCGEITVDLLIKVFQYNQNTKLAEQTQCLSEYGKKFRSKEHFMCELVSLWSEFDNALFVGQKQKFKLFALLCQQIFLPEFMTKSLAKAFLKSHQAFIDSLQNPENKPTSLSFSPEIAILISSFILKIKDLELHEKLALGLEKLQRLFPYVDIEKLKIYLGSAFYFTSQSTGLNLKKSENCTVDLSEDLGNVLQLKETLIPENRCVIPRFEHRADYTSWFLRSQLYQELLRSPDLQQAIIEGSANIERPINLTIMGLDGGIRHGAPTDQKSGISEEFAFVAPVEYCSQTRIYICYALIKIIIKDHHSPILETREKTDSTQTQVLNWLETISPFDVKNFGLLYRVLEPIKGCDPDNLNSNILGDLENLQFIKKHWEIVKKVIQICGWIDVSVGAPDTKLYDLEYFNTEDADKIESYLSTIKFAQIMLVNQLTSPFSTYFTLNRDKVSQEGDLTLEDGILKMGAAQLLSLSEIVFFSFIKFLKECYPVNSSSTLNSLDQLLKRIFDRTLSIPNMWKSNPARLTLSIERLILDFVEIDLHYYWSQLKSDGLDQKLVHWIKTQTKKMLAEILTSSNEDCYKSNQINLISKNESQTIKLVLVTDESNYTRGQLLNLGYSHFLSYKGKHKSSQTLSVITSGVLGPKTPPVIECKRLVDGCLNKLFSYYLKRDTPAIRGGLQAGSKEVGTPSWEVVEKCHKIVVLAIQDAIEKYGENFDTIKEVLEFLTPEIVMGEARNITLNPSQNRYAQMSRLFSEIDKT